MTILSSILGWEIPWTEELGGRVHGIAELDMTGHPSILALKELIVCGTNT